MCLCRLAPSSFLGPHDNGNGNVSGMIGGRFASSTNQKRLHYAFPLLKPQTLAIIIFPATVTFEGGSERHVNNKTFEERRHEEDVDLDGDMDLVLHFRNGETSLSCSSSEGTLSRETFDGKSIGGTDAVNMVEAENS